MFKPEARDFLLFKTSFHTEAEVRRGAALRCWLAVSPASCWLHSETFLLSPSTLCHTPAKSIRHLEALVCVPPFLPAAVQLLKPAAARRYAAEVQFDPRAQPQLVFETAATVTGAWTTADPDHVLQLLNELHVWGPGFLEKRLRWRQKQPVTILELRAYRLHTPIALPAQDDYWGCFSWLDLGGCQQLPGQLAAAGVPALSDAAFEAKQQLCRRQLALLSDVQELEF